MLNIHNLSVSFQGEDLFKEITFRLGAGDRAGLIGKNGAGKSTMLKIISGDQEYDTGQIALAKEVQIGFLRQDIDFIPGRTVLEESYQAFELIKKLEFQIAELNDELTSRTDYESEEYAKIIEDVTPPAPKIKIFFPLTSFLKIELRYPKLHSSAAKETNF